MAIFKKSDLEIFKDFAKSISDRWFTQMDVNGHTLCSIEELKQTLISINADFDIELVNKIVADSLTVDGIKVLKRKFTKYRYERTRPVARLHQDTLRKLETIKYNACLDSLDEAIDCLLDPENFIAKHILHLQLNESHTSLNYEQPDAFNAVYWQELIENVSPEAQSVLESVLKSTIQSSFKKGLEHRKFNQQHLDDLVLNNRFLQLLSGAELSDSDDEGER